VITPPETTHLFVIQVEKLADALRVPPAVDI
jgi:hypothetical protein